MKPCFMTPSGQPLKRWSAAFPDLVVRSDIKSCVQSGPTDGRLYWLDIVAYPEADAFDAIRSLSEAGGRVIALTAQPNDAEAFALLSAGARGYCHAEAVPEQLREVASVVESGGIGCRQVWCSDCSVPPFSENPRRIKPLSRILTSLPSESTRWPSMWGKVSTTVKSPRPWTSQSAP
jgi:DNA-binding NarL/FixJ family response regulator